MQKVSKHHEPVCTEISQLAGECELVGGTIESLPSTGDVRSRLTILLLLSSLQTHAYSQEFIVKGLAESRTFQRMALRTHNTIQETKKAGTQHVEATMEELAKMTSDSTTASATNKGPPQPPLRGVPGFFAAFAKEVRKDIMGTK